MYEHFYRLRERPFALTPDPEYLYPSRVHQEALSYLRYGVESHAGFVVITGEIGSGKTTLLQALLNGLDPTTTVARIVNTMLEPNELLEAIMFDLGLDATGMSKPAMLRGLARFLVSERQKNHLVLLVIDEAQNLGLAALEEIRMLSNLETEKSKLIQVILVGQPNLRDKLLRPELEQLRQRITVSYHLEPLDADETAAYINHRLRRAALGPPLVFSRAVTDHVFARSKGLPRLVNVVCDAILVFGYAEERSTIDAGLVEEVLDELDVTGVLPRGPGEPRVEVAPSVQPATAAAPSAAPASASDLVAAASALDIADLTAGEPARMDALRNPHDGGFQTNVSAGSPRADAGRHVDRVPSAPAPRVRPDTRPPGAWNDHPTMLTRISEREEHLRSREQQIVDRERELAEQKRVLAEEFRLLRERFSRAGAFAPEEAPAWPPVARPARPAPRQPVHRGRIPFQEFEEERPRGGFWRRVRVFLGVDPIEG